MAIHHTCRCGANIRLPSNVVGRKARCNSCGLIFVVPQSEKSSEPESVILLEPGLPDRPAHKSATRAKVEEFDLASLEYGDRVDILAPTFETPGYLPPETESGVDGQDDIETRRSYWTELAGSFLFFLNGSSLITFIFITLIQLFANGVAYAIRFSALGLIANLAIWGYLCNFYMSVVKETAGGEDELPNITPDFSDAFWAVLHFVGTFLWVMLPAIASAVICYANFGDVNMTIVGVLAVIGLFFWPVVMLCVAIGGGFYGLWPHTIIRTAIAAPLAYLALCGVLLVAAGIKYLPNADFIQPLLTSKAATSGPGQLIVLSIINLFLTTYTTIVAMRVIGLYYRHHKHKFPWSAE